MTIDQTDTERMLRERMSELGGDVEWGTSLLEFDGSEYGGTMRMMDVPVSGYGGDDNAIHYHIARDHMLLINKLPGEIHRVLISDKTEGAPADQALEAFQGVVDQHFDGEVTLGEPTWATNFRVSKRQTNKYRQGRIFLAGDAAHVISPAGGQGMNVAMQDAFNLGWKLAAVARGDAPPTLLESYEDERRPVASQMLEGTNYMHSIIMAHGKGMEERIARMKGGEWNAEAVNQVAGISYTYRDPEVDAPLAAGDRAPDVALKDGERMYDKLRGPGHALLYFADGPVDVIVDENGRAEERYSPDTQSRACVVRPDLHISHIGSLDDTIDTLNAQLNTSNSALG